MEQACAKVLGRKRGEESKREQLLGSAFFVSETLLITCRHAVECRVKDTTLYVKPYAGHAPLPIKTWHTHDQFDLAILELDTAPPFSVTPIPLATQERESVPESGDASAWGFTVDTEKCEAKTCSIIPYREKYEKIGFEPHIPNGFSGGPLLDAQGQCVGVVIAKSNVTECSYAEPVFLLHRWLQQKNITINTPTLMPWQKAYLKNLIDEMKWLRSQSLMQSLYEESEQAGTPLKVRLAALYVPLCVNRSIQARNLDHDRAQPEASEPPMALAALTETPRVVLRGDPGCGKTTFTRYWALRFAMALCNETTDSEVDEAIPPALINTFPVHLELDALYRKIPKIKRDNEDITPKDIALAMSGYFADYFSGLECIEQLDDLTQSGQPVLWLLDGLDEIQMKDALRDQLLEALNRWAGQLDSLHHICLTTRPYAYPQGLMGRFEELMLQPLSEAHRFDFITRFFRELPRPPTSPGRSGEQLVQVLNAPERQHLLALCGNPMLLTLTTTLYFKDGETALPRDRAGLYALCIDRVLDRWEQKRKNRNNTLCTLISHQVPRATVLSALSELAFYAHLNLASEATDQRERGDITKPLLEQHFFPAFDETLKQQEIEDYLYHKTGVLIDRNNGRYAFMHRTFREFLAARYLLNNTDGRVTDQFLASIDADPGWWREVMALGAKLHDTDQDNHQDSARASRWLMQCLPYSSEEVEDSEWDSTLVQRILACGYAECERYKASDQIRLNQAWRHRLAHWLLRLIGQDENPTLKAEAGRYLGGVGDPRPGTGLMPSVSSDDPPLPDIQWADIPAGEVQLEDHEKPFFIDGPFNMAIYPITHQQFQAFVKHPDGYDNLDWWEGFSGRCGQTDSPRWDEANHPRVDVDWYEATAFCRWLTVQYRQRGLLPITDGEIRLPYEWEWQQAARSGDLERYYPWLGDECTVDYANIDESVGRTTAVGLYRRGKSDQGVYDLSGNVWEWCANNYDDPEKMNEQKNNGLKTIRGGAWDGPASDARAACRDLDHPDDRDGNIGFRVVCVPPR